MTRLFLDTSALAKRYIREKGSERIMALCREAQEICVSVLALPECISALNRLRREVKLTADQYETLKESLAADVEHLTMVPIDETVIAASIRLLERHPLRAVDAIHIASAVEAGCRIFATADDRQHAAARREGLHVEHLQAR